VKFFPARAPKLCWILQRLRFSFCSRDEWSRGDLVMRKAMMVVAAAVLSGLLAPRAASAGAYNGFEYGAGWGDGVVYGPGRYATPHYYPHNYPYEGYPYIGYDGPPFYVTWDYGADCYVMRRPHHRGWRARTVQLCD
jgi:hypothetical protein